MKKQTLEVLGVPYLLPAAVIAVAVIISAVIARPCPPPPKEDPAEGRKRERITTIKDQFLSEVNRQSKTFTLGEVRNIRITEPVGTRKIIAIDFDYTEKWTKERAEIKEGKQTHHNFELEQNSYGKYSGTLRVAGDAFYVTIY